MISSANVAGGLANQMFQYAAAYAHSLRVGADCFYPEKPEGHDGRSPNLHEIFRLSADRTGVHGPPYHEGAFQFIPIPPYSDITLHGYFQSEKYFEDFKDEVRKEFTFIDTCSPPPPDTVSIHVRRSDYVEKPQYHPLCTMEYYKKAMDKFDGCKFLVFSDDKEWCLKWFDMENVKVSLVDNHAHELQLMSLCDHHILANSSFSWWAAWLGKNEHRKVVAPKTWFGTAFSHDTSDLYLPEWETI